MGRVHHIQLFIGRDAYVVSHPSSPDPATGLPMHAVGRIRVGSIFAYSIENAPVLWSMLRRDGYLVCASCKVGKCTEVVWDPAWIQATGMSRFETVPEWEKIWDRMFVQETRENPALPLAVHEAFLGLVPPYEKNDVLVAFKKAAMKAHPDRGGSNEAMRRAIEARDALLPTLGA